MSPMAKMWWTLVRISRSTAMKPRSSTARPAASAPIALAVRPPADRNQHGVEGLGLRPALALVGDDDPLGFGLDRRHLGLEQDLFVELAEALGERRDDVGIGARHELVHHFDDRDLRAERPIDGRHFEADDAAAEHKQAVRLKAQFERGGRIPDARIGRDEARRDRLRARRDDRLGEAHGARALGRLDPQRIGRGERARPRHHRHLALAREAGEAGREALDDAVLPVADRGRDRASAIRSVTPCAAIAAASSMVLATCSSAFGGNAADIQANAAERRPLVDDQHLLAEVGGAEGGGVAARPRPEHHEIGLEIDVLRRPRARGADPPRARA